MITHPVRKERYLNVLVFGEYGIGKTHFAATADDVPQMRDVLYIDAESGDLTLQNRPKLDIIPINKFSQLARIYEFLKIHCAARDADDKEKLKELDMKTYGMERTPPRYKTVIIDSLSEVFRYAMYGITGVQLGKQALDVEPDQPGYAEWGKVTEQIRLLVRSFRDLPMHVIFVCSEKSADDKNKRASIQLNLPKALAGEVPGFLDIVGYLSVQSVGGDKNNPITERRLVLQPGGVQLAKCRFNIKKGYIEEPTLGKLYSLIQEAG